MEREPLEPAVLAVELYRDDISHRRRTWTIAAVALGCSLLGAVAVLAILRFAPQWIVPEQVKVVQVPSNKSPGISHSTYSEPPSNPPLQPKQNETTEPSKEKPIDPAPQTTPLPENTAPLNPFSGAIIGRSPLPEGWTPGQPAPHPESDPSGTAGKPSNTTSKEPPTQDKGTSAILVTARSSASDPEGEANSVVAALQGAGASVRAAQHYNLAGSVIGVQIVATVPAGSVDSVISRLSSAGVGGADKWSGGIEARSDRVAGILASRIRELRNKETEMKEKYEEDATEVAVIREEIQKLNQGLGMARSAKSTGIAVILIGIGAL